MRAELYRADDPEKLVAFATWSHGRATLEVIDRSMQGLDALLRPTPVVVDDPSLRGPGTHGESLLEPGSFGWFRAALVQRAEGLGLRVRFVRARDRRRLGSGRHVPVVRRGGRAAGLVLSYAFASTQAWPGSQNGRKSQKRQWGPGVGSKAAAPIPRSHIRMRSRTPSTSSTVCERSSPVRR